MKNSKYFSGVNNIEDAKALYRRLVMKWHPDLSHDPDATRIIAEINTEWEKVFAALKDVHKRSDGSTYTETREDKKSAETAGEFAEIIAQLVKLDGITVELVGSWVWVSGNTFPHKDVLKAMGFQWAAKKRMWNYHKEPWVRHGKREIPMEAIKAKYGCTRYEAMEQLKLA